MKWSNKFKVGQEVKVVKKIASWDYAQGYGRTDWVDDMSQTINKIYKIIEINERIGYKLHTQLKTRSFSFPNTLYDYWYPVESLQACVSVGQQLLLFELD